MVNETFANPEILSFYKSMPFNLRTGLEYEVKAVYERSIDGLYPGLSDLIDKNTTVLEVGCGIGWLSNSINFLYKSPVLGIDFNPVAINIAQEVAKTIGLTTKFLTEDLFLYNPYSPFDVVISFGVLHHTNNCKIAIQRLCDKFVRSGGYVMIGLYHRYGRRPFLKHFNEMKKRGATEEEMFARYKQLKSSLKDEIQILSWFKDQVLNPFETQHTIEEMVPILKESGMSLISTSINKFQPIKSLQDLIRQEKEYLNIAEERLKNNIYFPGFFIFLARKN